MAGNLLLPHLRHFMNKPQKTVCHENLKNARDVAKKLKYFAKIFITKLVAVLH